MTGIYCRSSDRKKPKKYHKKPKNPKNTEKKPKKNRKKPKNTEKKPKKTERYRKFQIWDWFFSVFFGFFWVATPLFYSTVYYWTMDWYDKCSYQLAPHTVVTNTSVYNQPFAALQSQLMHIINVPNDNIFPQVITKEQ